MCASAFLPLPVDRWVPAFRRVRLIGIDATLSSSRIEVRYGGDVPGAPLLRLDSTATPGAAGIRLVGVSYESGGPVSTFELVFGEASIAALPFSGARGVEAELAYDWVITVGGRKRVLAGGPFIVLPGVTGADASLAQRPSAFATARAWHATDLTFGGGEVIEVSVDGVTLLTPYVDAAQSAADASIASAAEARVRADASAADARATGLDRAQVAADRIQTANDRAQGQAARDATLAAITGAGGTIATPSLVMPALTIAALKAAAIPANGSLTQLLEPGRIGLFRFDTSDLSAIVTADLDGGLVIAPNAGTTGAKGAWVRQVSGTQYEAAWWGVLPGAAGMTDRINRALKLIPTGATFNFGPGRFLLTKASAGTVRPTSAGITGAIVCDKAVTLQGAGDETILDGNGGAFDVIELRASHCKVTRLRAGNVAGQLIVNEAAAICIKPSNFVQGSGVGANIENFTIEDVTVFDADSGVTASSEMDRGVTPYKMWLASGVDVFNCRLRGIRRQGVELFMCDRSTVRDCDYIGGSKGSYGFSRFIRQIGSKNVVISGNKARATVLDFGYFGVQVETAGYYGEPEYYEISGDTIIENNYFENFEVALSIDESRGHIAFNNNNIIQRRLLANDAIQVFAVRLNGSGIRDPNGSTTSSANKMEIVSLSVRHNVARGVTGFIYSPGRIISVEVVGNTHYGQRNQTGSFFSLWTTVGNHPLEKAYRILVRDNTAYLSPNASESGVNRFQCGNPEATYDFNYNRMTPTAGGDIYTFSEPGTLWLESFNSNVTLTHDILADNFSPAKGSLWSGSLA